MTHLFLSLAAVSDSHALDFTLPPSPQSPAPPAAMKIFAPMTEATANQIVSQIQILDGACVKTIYVRAEMLNAIEILHEDDKATPSKTLLYYLYQLATKHTKFTNLFTVIAFTFANRSNDTADFAAKIFSAAGLSPTHSSQNAA